MKNSRFSRRGEPAVRPRMIAILILMTLMVFPAYAQDTPRTVTDDEVNAIAKRMYCPECENIPLDVCGTPACIQWRQEIRVQLEAGRTSDQIVSDFVARFGERVVGTPQDPTLRTLSLVTPWIVAVVAVIAAAVVMIRWRNNYGKTEVMPLSGSTAPANAPALTDEDYRQRLENDLLSRR